MGRILRFARQHWFISSSVIGGALLVGYFVFSNSSDTSTEVTQSEKTVTVARDDIRVTVSGSGQVEAVAQVNLKPVIAGDGIEVVTVSVKNDQEVKKSQLIATLDSEDAARDLESARFDLRTAEIKLSQTKKDFNQKTAEDRWARQLQEAAVAKSRLAVNKALSKLSDYSIRAPFDGIVTGLSVEAGDSLSQNTVLASVITKKLRVAITLNEVDAVKVKTGSMVQLTFDALPGTTVSGTLVKLDTIGAVEQNVVSFGAEIDLHEQPAGLRTGMSATAEIIVAQKSGVLMVPNSALSTKDGKTTVTIASAVGTSATERIREVTTGLTDETHTEIISGLKEGDRLVVSNTAVTAAAASTSSGQGSILNLFRGTGGNQSRSR